MANKKRERKLSDGFHVFVQASSFEEAGFAATLAACQRNPVPPVIGGLNQLAPMMTLLAFTIELYLKCLAAIDTGYFYTGHELLDRFDELDATTRDRIGHYFTPPHSPSDNQLDISRRVACYRNELQTFNNGFVDWRYAFEDAKLNKLQQFQSMPPSGSGIAYPCRRVVLERHPEWEQYTRDQTTVLADIGAHFWGPET